MRFEEYPPKVVEIKARYGRCRLCCKELVGQEAIFLPDVRAVFCASHTPYLVVKEYDDGYKRSYTVVDVVGTFEEACQKSNELNSSLAKARDAAGFYFSSYACMSVKDARSMRFRSVEIEE